MHYAICLPARHCFVWLLIKILEQKYLKAGRCLEIVKLTSLPAGFPGAWGSEKWPQGCLKRVVARPRESSPAWNPTPQHIE